MRFIDLQGEKFNKLTAMYFTRKNGRIYWVCKCDCGECVEVQASKLKSSQTKSCGCIQGKKKEYHGKSYTHEYRVWASIKARCTNPNNEHYKNYGGRGIKLEKSWADSFERFLSYVGARPTINHTIDRINTNKGYVVGNIRWATRLENQQNLRKSKFWIVGKKKYNSISEAATSEGVSTSTIERWCNGGKNNGKTVSKKHGCYSKLKYKEEL